MAHGLMVATFLPTPTVRRVRRWCLMTIRARWLWSYYLRRQRRRVSRWNSSGPLLAPAVRLAWLKKDVTVSLPEAVFAARLGDIANRSKEVGHCAGFAGCCCLWPGPAASSVLNRDSEVPVVGSEARGTGRRQPADFVVLLDLISNLTTVPAGCLSSSPTCTTSPTSSSSMPWATGRSVTCGARLKPGA